MAYFHIYTYLYDTFPLLIVNLQQQEILQLAVIVLINSFTVCYLAVMVIGFVFSIGLNQRTTVATL